MPPSIPSLPRLRRLAAGVAALALPALVPPAGISGGGALHAQGPTPVPVAGADLPVQEFVLENGMRFLVLERRAAPTVAFVSVVGVGGLHETLGSTGIAHLLEHLLFKGTTSVGTRNVEAERALFRQMDAIHERILAERARTRPDSARLTLLRDSIRGLEDDARRHTVPNEFDQILTEAGARGLNASTDNEVTTYHVELPRNRAELWFALESDRILNPVFREFYAERDVVVQERRLRVDTSPAGTLYEEHLAAAFTMHPYGVPVVGYMSDLETLTRARVREYYRRYYGPGNTVVAVVGDVDAGQIREWAREYFEDVPPGERPAPVLAREPEQRGVRRIDVRFDAQPSLRMGWKVPSIHHPDTPALATLAALLTGGRTSFLYRRLVQEERLATQVFASLGPGSTHPRLLTVEAVPRAPHTAADLEARILELVDEFTAAPPPAEALARIRNQLEAGAVRRLQSNLGLALQLAASASTLDRWDAGFAATAAMTQVEPDHVQAVARRYLRDEGLTVATLVPVEPEEGPE